VDPLLLAPSPSTVAENLLISGLHSAATGSFIDGNLVSGPVASGRDAMAIADVVSTGSASVESRKSPATKRKSTTQVKTGTVGKKARVTTSINIASMLENDFPPAAEQPAVVDSRTSVDTAPPVLPALTLSVFDASTPAIDLSAAPVLTGPHDEDGDIVPAHEGCDFPSPKKTLELCLIQTEGHIPRWTNLTPEAQRRQSDGSAFGTLEPPGIRLLLGFRSSAENINQKKSARRGIRRLEEQPEMHAFLSRLGQLLVLLLHVPLFLFPALHPLLQLR
jgi:hypothetical protein